MSKVIVSFANGQDFCDMLGVSLPTFYKYAEKHNYDIWIPCLSQVKNICDNYGWNYERPPSWLKVPIMKKALENYNNVLWLDSDIVISKFYEDVANYLPEDYIQAFTIHRDNWCGFVPNCGVWLVNKNANQLLDLIWQQEQYTNHHWWEQMANIHLMNWVPKSTHQNLSEYGNKSAELPFEFNVHKNDIRFTEDSISNGIFLHGTMWSNRLEKMKEWVAKNDKL